MTDKKQLPGKFTWFEHVCSDSKRAQAFYGEVLGWKVQGFPMGNFTYEMIFAGDTMIGGYASPKSGQKPHWISYVSVPDVDAAAKTAAANGGKVLETPFDIPTVGRKARIADPGGAEICLFKSANGDPPDGEAPQGHFFWNELHVEDPKKVLGFYEKVVGYKHDGKDMGPGGVYYLLEEGGVGRGGVTHHLPAGVAPHWLPYVSVDDVDGTLSRAKKLGGTIPMGPEDIPGIGRFGVIIDPAGAAIAVMKPLPRDQQKM